MKKILKEKGFIAKRGFKNLISHFVEMLEKREWQALGEHKEPGYAVMSILYTHFIPMFYLFF